MSLTWWQVFSVIITVALLAFLTWFNTTHNFIANLIKSLEIETKYSPTQFLIYDNSTEDKCDRLIQIQPFNWWIWACNGECYVLNPEGGLQCPINNSSAVKILDNQYIETCLNINVDNLINVYKKYKMYTVDYTIPIDTQKFTILSALNILTKNYITFDTDILQTRTLNYNDDTDNAPQRNHYNSQTGRQISNENFIKITTNNRTSDNHNKLLSEYRVHVGTKQQNYNLIYDRPALENILK